MSEIINKAKSHFQSRVTSELGAVHVPEWECNIYFYKAETLATQKRIAKKINDRGGSGEDAMVQALIERARNKDGEKIFRQVHFTELMNEVDKEVIEKILNSMAEQSENDNATKDAVEAAEKN